MRHAIIDLKKGNLDTVKWVVLVLLLIVFSSDGKSQIFADFVTTQDSGCAPFVARFADNSSPNIVYRHWDFGNGNTATGNNISPSAAYNNSGRYDVSLTISDGVDTVTITKTNFVTVLALPVANINYPSTLVGCAPYDFNVQDASVAGDLPILSWRWDFDDGTPLQYSQNVNHHFSSPGTFSISLIVSDSMGCSSSKQLSNLVTVHPKPRADFYSNDSLSVCGPPITVNLLNSSTSVLPLTYNWLFNGVTSTNANTVATFTNSGGYDAQLIVTNTIGCADTMLRRNYVWIGTIIASMDIVDTACVGVATGMKNTSHGGTDFAWNFGDGGFDTGDSVQHIYANPGTYTVTMVSSAGSVCDDTVTQSLYVEEIIPAFTSTPKFACEAPLVVNFTDQTPGNIVAWNWHFGNPVVTPSGTFSNTSRAQNPSNVYLDEGKYDDTLTVTSSNGCMSTVIVPNNEEIIFTKAVFVVDVDKGCAPLIVDFTNLTDSVVRIDTMYWDYGDGSPKDSTFSPNHIYPNPGEYNVELTVVSIMGCTTSFIQEIKVGTQQIADFSVDTIIGCASDTFTYTNLSTDTTLINEYFWEFGDGKSADVFEPKHLYQDTGYMSVTLVVKYNGCPDTLIIDSALRVSGPLVHFGVSYNCDSQNVVQFVPDIWGGTNVYWDFGDSTGIDSVNWNPSHAYPIYDTNYPVTLTVIDTNTGCFFMEEDQAKIRYLKGVLSIADTTICKGSTIFCTTGTSINALSFVLWSRDTLNSVTPGKSVERYLFDVKGPQSIYAVVMDEHSCRDTVSRDVFVYEPIPNFGSLPISGCSPLLVLLHDSSTSDTNIVAWDWDFGDGTTSTIQNPPHLYRGIGNNVYDVSLTVTDTFGCSLTKDSIGLVSVYQPPSYFETVKTQVCAQDSVPFSKQPTGALSYFWDFGDGFTSTLMNPKHTYSAGTYTISLKTTDIRGCDSTYTRTNYLEAQTLPVADFSANPLVVDCYPASVSFLEISGDTNIVDWQWNFGDSPNYVTLSSTGAQNLYNLPGRFDVTMVVTTDFGCTDTITKPNFILVGGPTGEILYQPDIGCVDQSVVFDVANANADAEIFTWDFGDGVVDTTFAPEITANHVYASKGNYNVTLLLSNSQRTCQKTDTTSIEIDLVKSNFNISDTSGCTPFTFQASSFSIGSDSLSWFIDGVNSSQLLSDSFYISKVGTHEFKLIVYNAYSHCSDTTITKIKVNPLPKVSTNPDGFICIGDSSQLYAKGAKHYVWTPALGLNNDVIRTPKASPMFSTNYTVVGTDSNGCINSDSTYLEVQQKPKLLWITPDTFIFTGADIQLETSISLPVTYSWSPPSSMGCTDCPDPWVKPVKTTTYNLIYSDLHKCFIMDTNVTIEVNDEFKVTIPNAFSPNNDNLNDTFFPVTYGVEEFVYMRIFDRWGVLVYETNDINAGWDGRHNGKIAAHNSAFTYQIRVKRFTGEFKDFVGMVVLVSD